MADALTLDAIQNDLSTWKKGQEDVIAEFKKQATIDFATPGAIDKMGKEMEEKLKALNQYAENIEKQLKGKTLTPAEQLSFNQLLGKAVTDNWTEISKLKESNTGIKYKMPVFDTKAAGDMTIANNVLNGGAYFQTVLPGIRTLPNRKVHMRDIIPLGTMSTSTLFYMRETGGEGKLFPWEVTLPATTKPQIDLDFEGIDAPAEYIAGFLRVSKKMLDDMDAFRSYLQMRLMEMYLKAEDWQILNGNGTTPQLDGILSVATPAIQITGPNIERLVWSIAQLESSDYTADGGVVHPAMYYALALNKATGSGEYDLPGVVVVQNGQLYIAGIPMYRTTAIEMNTYIVGAWSTGAQLFIREQPTVQFFDQDANNVTTNQITVRIEGRVALAIYRAEAFVTGQFDLTGMPNFPVVS